MDEVIDLGFDGVYCDLIEGGAGDDLITGGNGHDALFGGDGADIFVFKGLFGGDIIEDFDVAEDELVLANNARFTAEESGDGIMLEFSNGASIEFETVQLGDLKSFSSPNGQCPVGS